MGEEARIVALMDIGTYSVRLMLVRINPDLSHNIINDQKEVVRLGEGEFGAHRLQPEAMSRAALVCRKFAEMARSFGATEIVAVATASSREARNRNEFLRQLKGAAQLDVRTVSGREEARLIYLGVASGFKLGAEQALFMDVGGGSTELIVGNQEQYQILDSLKLGAIRLTNLFFEEDETGPISRSTYGKIQRHVRNIAIRTVQRLRQQRCSLAVGSSGTIVNLAEVACQALHGRPWAKDDPLPHKDLRQVVELLCAAPLKERRRIPGINPGRADILIAGAAIVDTLMEELDLSELRISERGLRDGLLADYLTRFRDAKGMRHSSLRERSVLQLARVCNFDETHARNVARLALGLFDSAKEAELHKLGAWERELLEYAALLHDIGVFISHTNHQAHSHYLIRNADLLGFDQMEIALLANTAFFHRKAFPGKDHLHFIGSDERTRKVVVTLATLLRLAESLDRSHLGLVRKARLSAVGKNDALLLVEAAPDAQLELWGVNKHLKVFKKAFDRKLTVEPVLATLALKAQTESMGR